jgi:N-acetylmuramic acid 6-phosphate etherase
MATKPRPTGNRPFLGIECGGTRTVALLADGGGTLVKRVEAGPANLRLLSKPQLLRHFKSLANEFSRPAALGIGMAGMRTEADRRRIITVAAKVWPGIPCAATDDLETALSAGMQNEECKMKKFGGPARKASSFIILPPAFSRVLVLSGTGSCCYGKTSDGRTAKVGGWGHLLGDHGSGYEIGLFALKAVIAQFDRDGALPELGRRFLRSLLLNEPSDFVAWAQAAGKADIAALARDVFAAGHDKIAVPVLDQAAERLAQDAIACARRLGGKNARADFILAGSILLKQPGFAKRVAARIKRVFPKAVVSPLARESAWGAVELARQKAEGRKSNIQSEKRVKKSEAKITSPSLSPTELRNPRSMNLDKLPTAKAIQLMLSEDAKIPAAILAERKKIERAIGWIVASFKRGGKLFYIGAGTSGRLGILDASECPPTFRTPPEMVQGIIAGGQPAICQAVEGAEDDAAAGARTIGFRGVSRRDVVVGIAASGGTPFVWGALNEAKRRGARTVLLCFNPHLKIPRAMRPDQVIAPNVGPEILTGSTRLKAGTATKLVLNMFTTLSMVRLGKVAGNLMVDLNPSNTKLRIRALRIVRELTGADEDAARAALEKSGWAVKAALRQLKRRDG